MNTAYSRKTFKKTFQIKWIQIKNQDLLYEYGVSKKKIQNNISNSMDLEKHSRFIV